MLPHDESRTAIFSELAKNKSRSIIKLFDAIITDACIREASDIHLDPKEKVLLVRLRIDGILEDTYELPLHCHTELLARIKILASLRVDEHFTAQDGSFPWNTNCPPDSEKYVEITLRVSILPTAHGENAVLRIHKKISTTRSLVELGMCVPQEAAIAATMKSMRGLILVTGPTGSGKTTTLYSLIHELAQQPLSIVSIEDPIEYTLPTVRQVPVHTRALSLNQGLRALLRQDPDVIMVGEIRDMETANLAVHAALTGHLVLSTLHTNDALSSIARLASLGVEKYILEATLRLCISQRLIRKTCSSCKVCVVITQAEKEEVVKIVGAEYPCPDTQFVGMGCEDCGGTTFKGRVGIFEILPITKDVFLSIAHTDVPEHLSTAPNIFAIEVIKKIEAGLTTVHELIRAWYV